MLVSRLNLLARVYFSDVDLLPRAALPLCPLSLCLFSHFFHTQLCLHSVAASPKIFRLVFCVPATLLLFRDMMAFALHNTALVLPLLSFHCFISWSPPPRSLCVCATCFMIHLLHLLSVGVCASLFQYSSSSRLLPHNLVQSITKLRYLSSFIYLSPPQTMHHFRAAMTREGQLFCSQRTLSSTDTPCLLFFKLKRCWLTRSRLAP